MKPRALLPIMPMRPENAAEIPTAIPAFLWNQLFKRMGAAIMHKNEDAIPWIMQAAYHCHSSVKVPMAILETPNTTAAALMTARTSSFWKLFATNGRTRAELME